MVITHEPRGRRIAAAPRAHPHGGSRPTSATAREQRARLHLLLPAGRPARRRSGLRARRLRRPCPRSGWRSGSRRWWRSWACRIEQGRLSLRRARPARHQPADRGPVQTFAARTPSCPSRRPAWCGGWVGGAGAATKLVTQPLRRTDLMTRPRPADRGHRRRRPTCPHARRERPQGRFPHRRHGELPDRGAGAHRGPALGIDRPA